MTLEEAPEKRVERAERREVRASDLTVQLRRHAAGFVAEALDSSGRSLGILEAERRNETDARVTRFSVVEGKEAGAVGEALLGRAADQGDRLSFRWRKEGSGGTTPGCSELLREGARSDQFWAGRAEGGPRAHFDAEEAEGRDRQVGLVADQIGSYMGDSGPELRDRLRFLDPPVFEDELVARGDSLAEAKATLGVYYPASMEILVRDSPEAWRQNALLHEGLHAWREERAAERVPAPLNEALTQHFTERIDPAAGKLMGVEQLPDGRTRFLVPGFDRAPSDGPTAFERAPEVYPDATRTVRMLEAHVGTAVLKEYYRTGDPQRLHESMTEALGRSAWPRFVEHARTGRWDLAAQILRPAARP